MVNIHEILKKFEISIPADKKEEFDKLMVENYKTVKEVSNLQGKLENMEKERDTYKEKYDTDIKQRDADIKDLQTKLKDAGTDSTKLTDLENQLTTLQETYKKAKDDYESQLSKQAYEFAVKEKVAELKFSSNSAKKAFIADAINEGMKLKDGQLQGFDDFLESYKKNDADAFLKEDKQVENQPKSDDKPKPQFSGKSSNVETQSGTETEQSSSSITFF